MPNYPNGLGQSLGDTLATTEPLQTSGNVWYVLSTTGADAASPRGLDATRPLATIGQAITNAANDDIICLLSGHTETVSATTISKNLVFVGAGQSSSKPTVKLTPAAADAVVFTVSGADVEFRNIWFEERTAASTAAVISVTGAGFRMIGCYCESGQYDTGAKLNLGSGADRARLVNTTFISTATSLSAQPAGAINIGAAITCLELDGLILSGGSYGWSAPYVLDGSTAAITRLKGLSVSLLLGADVTFHASTTGFINVATSTGGAQVVWAV